MDSYTIVFLANFFFFFSFSYDYCIFVEHSFLGDMTRTQILSEGILRGGRWSGNALDRNLNKYRVFLNHELEHLIEYGDIIWWEVRVDELKERECGMLWNKGDTQRTSAMQGLWHTLGVLGSGCLDTRLGNVLGVRKNIHGYETGILELFYFLLAGITLEVLKLWNCGTSCVLWDTCRTEEDPEKAIGGVTYTGYRALNSWGRECKFGSRIQFIDIEDIYVTNVLY